MKKYIFSILFLFGISFQILSQEKTVVRGTVYMIIDGRHVAASDIKMEAVGANRDITKDNGSFKLEYVTKKPGAKLELSIGETDVDGLPVALVDEAWINELLIPESGELKNIYICRPEEKQEASELYTSGKIVEKFEDVEQGKIQEEIIENATVLPETHEEDHTLKNKIRRNEEENRTLKDRIATLEAWVDDLMKKETISDEEIEAIKEFRQKGELEKLEAAMFNENLGKSYENVWEEKRAADNEIKRILNQYEVEAEYLFREKQDYIKAGSFFEKICEIYDDNDLDPMKQAYYSRLASLSFMETGDINKAEDYLKRAIQTIEDKQDKYHSSLPNHYVELAYVYFIREEYGRAIDNYEKAAKIVTHRSGEEDITLSRIFNSIALSYKKSNDQKRAEQYYQKVISIVEISNMASLLDKLNANHNAAIFYEESERYDQAINHYDQIISLLKNAGDIGSSKLGDYLVKKAVVYQAKGDYDTAMKTLDEAMAAFQQEPQQRVGKMQSTQSLANNMMKQRGLDHFHKKEFQEAVQDFTESLAVMETSELYELRGKSHYGAGSYDLALADYESAAELDPTMKQDNFYALAGMVYLRQGENRKAKDAFERYENVRPGGGLADAYWAAYEASRGNKKRALDALSNAMENGFSDASWLEEETAFDSIRSESKFQQILSNMRSE